MSETNYTMSYQCRDAFERAGVKPARWLMNSKTGRMSAVSTDVSAVVGAPVNGNPFDIHAQALYIQGVEITYDESIPDAIAYLESEDGGVRVQWNVNRYEDQL